MHRAPVLSTLYAAAARERRRWFDRHPEARRRLANPVVSVGNLAAGGRGKTPTVAHLARLLVAAGERPAVLSRGYARRAPRAGVVVVSDGEAVRADLAQAGDEPLMLAGQLEGVPVLVCPDRHLAGVLAERRFGATVHLLDDGFQHMMLERDADLVLVDPGDVAEPRTLPFGRLREPVETLARADAVVVDGDVAGTVGRLAALGVRRVFGAVRRLGAPRWLDGRDAAVPAPGGARVLAVAAVARPARFAADLAAAGWQVVGVLPFRDHHPFTRADLDRMARRAAADRADLVLTTEKDRVRLRPLLPATLPIAWVPLEVGIEPAGAFRDWLLGRLSERRRARP